VFCEITHIIVLFCVGFKKPTALIGFTYLVIFYIIHLSSHTTLK